METLQSLKPQHPKTPLHINPNRTRILNPKSNFSFPNTFLQVKFRKLALQSSYNSGSTNQSVENTPISVELEQLSSESQFDRVVADAQHLEASVVVLWMASWCRKCIYLKPKLEKLAAEYYPRVRFYSVDVNSVPHKFVVRAGVTKMPTIQLWEDGEKQAEVIGGHKAYLVVNEVREMIDHENTM